MNINIEIIIQIHNSYQSLYEFYFKSLLHKVCRIEAEVTCNNGSNSPHFLRYKLYLCTKLNFDANRISSMLINNFQLV